MPPSVFCYRAAAFLANSLALARLGEESGDYPGVTRRIPLPRVLLEIQGTQTPSGDAADRRNEAHKESGMDDEADQVVAYALRPTESSTPAETKDGIAERPNQHQLVSPYTQQLSAARRVRVVWIVLLALPWVVTGLVVLLRPSCHDFSSTGLVVTPTEATWLAAWIIVFASVVTSGLIRSAWSPPQSADATPSDSTATAIISAAEQGIAAGQVTLDQTRALVGEVLAGTDAARRKANADAALRRRSGLRGLVVGLDGRVSTSKLQAVIWTYALLYTFIYLLLAGWRIWPRPKSPILADVVDGFSKLINHPLQTEYFVLLGIPLTAVIAAKALTTYKIAVGDLTKPIGSNSGLVAGAAESVSDDTGSVDLLDFQYTLFNLVMLIYFFATFFTRTSQMPSGGLPDLPPTLLALSGVSGAAYIAKKALEKGTAPQLIAVSPRLVVLGDDDTITLTGHGFYATATTMFNAVTIGTVALATSNWTINSVSANLPATESAAMRAGLATGDYQVVVTDDEGNQSNSLLIHIEQRSKLPKA